VQEVTRDDPVSLGGQELTPGQIAALRRGIDPGLL
jgi:hypothetical protein